MVQNDPMCIPRSKRATASWISASNLTGLLILLVLYASFLLVRYFILCPKVWQAQCHLLSYILVYFISKSQLNCLLLLEVFPNPVQRDMISSCVCLMLLNQSFSAMYYNNDACFSFPLQCFEGKIGIVMTTLTWRQRNLGSYSGSATQQLCNLR